MKVCCVVDIFETEVGRGLDEKFFIQDEMCVLQCLKAFVEMQNTHKRTSLLHFRWLLAGTSPGRENSFREHKRLDSLEDVDEDDQNSQVLDPCPFDHL